MDVNQVKRALGLFFILFSMTACLDQSPSDGSDKFSKTSLEDECREQAIDQQYIIKYYDGSLKLVIAENDQEFLKNHVQPDYDNIEIVDRNIKYKIPENPRKVSSFRLAASDWGQENIEANEAWENNIKGEGITVAVIDAGVSIDHPLLKNRIYKNSNETFNGIDDDNNGYIDDVYGYNFASDIPNNIDNSGHGTHVAGIIAGEHSINTRGEPANLGIAPEAKILPLDFIDENSGGTLLAAAKSIDYVLKMHEQMNIKIVNASWGGPFCSQILRSKIQLLADEKILFIAAAGNINSDIDVIPEFPAAYTLENVLTVGAINTTLGMASWSNYGDSSVDLFAPGEAIYSSVFSGGYAFIDGTSMAAPFVAGAAALLYSMKPHASAVEIKHILMNNGVFNPDYRGVSRMRLNVAEAINAI